ncbi:hypothetical protein CCP3SC15_530024 [Gammaproteobacteria bacterium]
MNPDPNYQAWIFLLFSLMAGAVRAINRCLRKCRAIEIASDVLTAGFTGVLAYHVCQYAGLNGDAAMFVVGTSAHQGTRHLWKLVNRFNSTMGKVGAD